MSWAELHDAVAPFRHCAAARRRPAGRSRRRLSAQHARDDCRRAAALPRSAQSGRRARRTSACRASSIGSGRSSRRVLSPSMATTTAASAHDCSAARGRDRQRACRRCEHAWSCRTSAHAVNRRRCADLPTWDGITSASARADAPFEPLPFNHPLYILYSSGTTGVPKCIVHGAGGTLHPASQGAPAPLRHSAPATASSTSRPAAG